MVELKALPQAVCFFLPFVKWWPGENAIFYRETKQLNAIGAGGRQNQVKVHMIFVKEWGLLKFLLVWFFVPKVRQEIGEIALFADIEGNPPLFKTDLRKHNKPVIQIKSLWS